MRDAFGGVFMIRLFLVFIVIFVAFSAVSLNYARAFRVKNNIIDFIETKEIYELNKIEDYKEQLDNILDKTGYYKTCENDGLIKNKENKVIAYCHRGVVFEYSTTQSKNSNNTKIITYNIYTYADWNLETLNKILILGGKKETSDNYVNGTWEIKGEAKVVKRS